MAFSAAVSPGNVSRSTETELKPLTKESFSNVPVAVSA